MLLLYNAMYVFLISFLFCKNTHTQKKERKKERKRKGDIKKNRDKTRPLKTGNLVTRALRKTESE